MRRGTVIGEAVARMLVGIGVGATITGIAVAAPQASSAQNLFKPGVARALDATIVRIIKQANLPSVAARAAISPRRTFRSSPRSVGSGWSRNPPAGARHRDRPVDPEAADHVELVL
jgi:hypothetical protein